MKEDKVWYEKGLQFGCTGCGGCCTGSPGFVWLNDQEVDQLVEHLGITKEQFLKKYTRKHFGRLALTEKGSQYDCVFLKDKQCTVYTARPSQCKTFPFWPKVLESKKAWIEEKKHCEGIEREGSKIYSLEEIQSIQETK
jgi:Fe-S-cluster containining protein